jgi:hypothetical protein
VWGHYPIASQAVHHGPRDLEHQIRLDHGGSAKLVFGPILEDAENKILTACKFLFVALEQFALSIGANKPAELDALYLEYSRAVDKFTERELATSG